MSRTDLTPFPARANSDQPNPPESEALREARDDLSSWILRWPLAGLLCGLVAIQYSTWMPHYLTWPFWADHDVFATMAHGWSAGQLPYRDFRCNNFPGMIYLYWALGQVAGWGKTLPFYAFDASCVLLLGVAFVTWSRRRLGGIVPGLAGYLVFLSFYLGLDYARAGQRDWYATLFAVLSLMAAQTWSGRPARLLSAALFALAMTFRPQVVLFLPGIAWALDESAREPGAPFRRTFRPCLEWGVAFLLFVALGFVPLALAGVLPDFINGVRMAAYGSDYNKSTPRSMLIVWLTQLAPFRILAVPVVLVLFREWGNLQGRRTALTWAFVFALVSLYKPLSPRPHAYLDIPLTVVWSISLATLVHLALSTRALAPTLRLGFVFLLLALGTTVRPTFCQLSYSVRALAALRHGSFPAEAPVGYGNGTVSGAAHYPWHDCRDVVDYLRTHTSPETRVANVLRSDIALTGSSGRLSAFPAESITWLRMVNPADQARFAQALTAAHDSVVVWVPSEFETPIGHELEAITAVIQREYEPRTRFGVIEVWQRRRDASLSVSTRF